MKFPWVGSFQINISISILEVSLQMAIVKNTWDHLQERFFKSIFILNMIALLRNQEFFEEGFVSNCMSLAMAACH